MALRQSHASAVAVGKVRGSLHPRVRLHRERRGQQLAAGLRLVFSRYTVPIQSASPRPGVVEARRSAVADGSQKPNMSFEADDLRAYALRARPAAAQLDR
jgi:hypothetical protein